MHIYKKGLLLIFILLAGYACQDQAVTPPEKTPFVLSDIRAADFWQINASASQLVEIRVQHPDGVDAIEAVTVDIIDNANNLNATVQLFDDGAATTESGDLIAGDGVFRNLIKPSTVVSADGDYTLRFSATDTAGASAPALEKNIKMGSNKVPQIHSVFLPSLFRSGFNAETISVVVFDPDSTSEVDDIIFKIIKSGELPVLYTGKSWKRSGADSLFVLELDSSFGAGRSGAYQFSFQAHDKFGGLSDTVLRSVNIENKAGSVLRISMPAEITKPVSGTKQIFITAQVDDPQSLADVDSVYFYIEKTDGMPFVMVDNGKPFNIDNRFDEAGDKTAGDGIYSRTLIVEARTAIVGTFVFSFYSRDRVGNLSVSISDSINIKP